MKFSAKIKLVIILFPIRYHDKVSEDSYVVQNFEQL